MSRNTLEKSHLMRTMLVSITASCVLSSIVSFIAVKVMRPSHGLVVEETLANHGASCNSYGFGVESVLVHPHPMIPEFSDLEVRLLRQLPMLKSVALHGQGITDEGMLALSECLSLETIDLSHTSITDVGLSRLESLPKLKKIILLKTNITNEGLAAFGERRPYIFVRPTKVAD